jgi:hypothetical protein
MHRNQSVSLCNDSVIVTMIHKTYNDLMNHYNVSAQLWDLGFSSTGSIILDCICHVFIIIILFILCYCTLFIQPSVRTSYYAYVMKLITHNSFYLF